MVDKIMVYGKLLLLSFFFNSNIDNFWRPFSLKFLGKTSLEEIENELKYCDIIIMLLLQSTLLSTVALNQSARDILPCYWKKVRPCQL